jgi:hypothetical protein
LNHWEEIKPVATTPRPSSQVEGRHYVTFTSSLPFPFEGEALAAFKSNAMENCFSIFSRKQELEL